MPQRTKFIRTYAELVRALGEPAVERRKFRREESPPRPQHSGWRWSCDCNGFVRPEGDGYMWVPCTRHQPSSAQV